MYSHPSDIGSCPHIAWMSRWATCMPLMTCCGVPGSQNILKKPRIFDGLWWYCMVVVVETSGYCKILWVDWVNPKFFHSPSFSTCKVPMTDELLPCTSCSSGALSHYSFIISIPSNLWMIGWRSPPPKGRRALSNSTSHPRNLSQGELHLIQVDSSRVGGNDQTPGSEKGCGTWHGWHSCLWYRNDFFVG